MAKKKHDDEASDSSSSNSSSSDSSASDSSASDSSSKKSKKKGKKVKTAKKGKKDKKSKKSKSGTRGPKGPQWTKWKEPFQPNSILQKTYSMAAKKGGIKDKDLVKFIKKAGGTPAFITRCLRKGENRGWTWDVDDAHGRLRITNAKLHKSKS
jgi:hypothetical protein